MPHIGQAIDAITRSKRRDRNPPSIGVDVVIGGGGKFSSVICPDPHQQFLRPVAYHAEARINTPTIGVQVGANDPIANFHSLNRD